MVFLGLSTFIIYSTWAAFQGEHYSLGNYLSPFYSPEIFGDSPHSWFGPKPDWWPSLLPFSPAFLILWAPAGFRLTCYYYRGAYYKAFWADPLNCAVGEPRKGYIGESNWPLIIMNIHRYFLYLALLFIVILWYDAIKAFSFDGQFGVGLGSLIMLANVVLLTGYTFSCHSLRHLVGGKLDCFSCEVAGKTRYKLWRGVSVLNDRHMLFAWLSLVSVGLTDFYIRLVAMGTIRDLRIL